MSGITESRQVPRRWERFTKNTWPNENHTQDRLRFIVSMMMKGAFTARQIIGVLCFWLVMPAAAASPQFMAAYEQLLGKLSSDFLGKESGEYDRIIVAGFGDLLKLGTREELGDAIATTLSDTSKRPLWMDSLSLSHMLGPQFDRSKIVAAIRGNLGDYFVLDESRFIDPNRRAAINIASTELCYYGTEDDVQLVKSFAAKVAKFNPGLAESLQMTVENRVKVRELRAKALSTNSAGILAPPPLEKGLPLAQQTPPPAQKPPPESKPPTAPREELESLAWSFIVVLIAAATGLLPKSGSNAAHHVQLNARHFFFHRANDIVDAPDMQNAWHLFSKSATSSTPMKRYLIAIGALLALQVIGADESESLREVLRKSITAGGLREDLLDQNLKSWPGIKTLDGVAALYDLWNTTTNGFELLACARIQERLQVPAEQVASFLMERANRSRDDTYMMMGYLDELEPYSDDPRVTKYYASLLSDKRPLNRNRRPVEGGHTVRVCDVALKNLTKWLEKKGLLKWGDPGFVWDVLHAEDFENNIVAIRPYLVKTGVIEGGKQSQSDGPGNLQPAITLDLKEWKK